MNNKMVLHNKQATKTGGSIRISLPPDWIKDDGIEHGDELDILESGLLVILPKREMKDSEISESFECVKRMIAIAYRNRSVKK